MRYFYLSILSILSLGLHAQSSQHMAEDSAFIRAVLDEHNAMRQEIQLPNLAWSADLAADARAWAKHLAEIGKGDHDVSIRGKEGENLWWGTAGAYSYTQMVDFWGSEKNGFVYGIFPDCRKIRSSTVGHYTQIIWKNTTSVGCALASNGKTDFLVCRYAPAGNIIGQKPY